MNQNPLNVALLGEALMQARVSAQTLHIPERLDGETQKAYRERRRASKAAVIPRDGSGKPIALSKNGGRTGAGMASIRAARKAANVRRHRAALRG